jgi:SAM-dependent methyltransferase
MVGILVSIGNDVAHQSARFRLPVRCVLAIWPVRVENRYMGDMTMEPGAAEGTAEPATARAGLDEVLWDPIARATLLRSHPLFDERVLDACAGDGATALPTAELVGPGGLVDAVAATEELIELVRERAGERMPQLRLHVGDPAEWPYTGYDLVQCVLGLPFLADPEAGARHLVECARPGGRAAFTVWARGALDPLPELLAGALPADDPADADARAPTEAEADAAAGAGPDAEPGADADADAEPDAETEADTGTDTLATALPASALLAVHDADTAGTFAHWLAGHGLVDVRAEAVNRHLDLDPELAWALVLGTPLRSMVGDLDDEALDGVRERYLAALAKREPPSVDITTLVAVGRRPG